MQLQRKSIRIFKESKPAAGIFIHPNRLHFNALLLQLFYRFFDIVRIESQVAQACGFGTGDPGRRISNTENLQFRVIIYSKIQLPVSPPRPVILPNNGKSKLCLLYTSKPIHLPRRENTFLQIFLLNDLKQFPDLALVSRFNKSC